MRKLAIVVGTAVVALALFTGCTGDTGVRTARQQTDAQLKRYQANQPLPLFDWSQYRQTAIDVESAQVHGIATTTFFFNLGVTHPVKVCPSIGYPMPSTAQLSNPSQEIGGNGAVVGQMEPNGIYTGDSTATYVVCVAPNGVKYISYWEGFVHTEGGPAHWDRQQGLIVLDGPPTVLSSQKKK